MSINAQSSHRGSTLAGTRTLSQRIGQRASGDGERSYREPDCGWSGSLDFEILHFCTPNTHDVASPTHLLTEFAQVSTRFLYLRSRAHS